MKKSTIVLFRFTLFFSVLFLLLSSFETKSYADTNNEVPSTLDVKDNMKLTSDLTVDGDLWIQHGKTLDLNGHTLTVKGSVDLVNIYSALLINKGNLIVYGSFTSEFYGNLIMNNDEDYISVAHDFIYNNPMTNQLSAGIVEVKGDFIQKNEVV